MQTGSRPGRVPTPRWRLLTGDWTATGVRPPKRRATRLRATRWRTPRHRRKRPQLLWRRWLESTLNCDTGVGLWLETRNLLNETMLPYEPQRWNVNFLLCLSGVWWCQTGVFRPGGKCRGSREGGWLGRVPVSTRKGYSYTLHYRNTCGALSKFLNSCVLGRKERTAFVNVNDQLKFE